jgi:hypothetical protein
MASASASADAFFCGDLRAGEFGRCSYIGYARTSTIEQAASFEAQQSQLKAAGCQKVFCEQVSPVAQNESNSSRRWSMRAKATSWW